MEKGTNEFLTINTRAITTSLESAIIVRLRNFSSQIDVSLMWQNILPMVYKDCILMVGEI